MANTLMTILPYWSQGTWVFDDESVELVAEPFVSGIPEMITEMVKDIPNAKKGFQRELIWVREEYEGSWYRLAKTKQEGWLCPAMFHYFEKAPKRLYVTAEPLK